MTTYQDQLAYSAGKYRIDDHIVPKPYNHFLPGDTVKYYFDLNGKIIITKIVNRKEQITLGIIGQNKIHYPLLPEYFKQWIPNNYEKGTRCQIHIKYNELKIIKIYKNISDRSCDTEILKEIYLSAYNDPSDELKSIIHNLNTITSNQHQSDHLDQTDLYTFNIDPQHSKDLDDAISIDMNQQKVYVHIVDIHSQLELRSPEDIRALCLAFTLYLPSAVENILSSELAENRLSLIKGEPRKVITVEFDISDTEPPKCVSVYPSIIKIKERYDYNNVLEPLITDSRLMWLYSISEPYFRSTLNLPTVKFHLRDESITGVTQSLPNVANKLVETWMIFTNSAISELLQQAPQRHHPASLSVPALLSGSSDVIDTINILKTYKNAYYSGSETGHYGLQFEKYTHFTSPLRRYFDVIIHRMIAGTVYPTELLTKMLEHLKDREKLVDDLALLYKKWKIFSRIEGQTSLTGKILKVMSSGVVVLLNEYLLESYIHVSKIKGKRWSYIDNSLVTDGEVINVGDNCSLRINCVNWLNSSLDLSINVDQ